MCGIAGFYSINSSLQNSESPEIKYALNAIKSRGPDNDGVYKSIYGAHNLVLIHARLAVIDLTNSGCQPMFDTKSNWCISYNGEIYNYKEIKNELQGLGWNFNGESDSEVLLKAWAQWGREGLSRLNGMFAFAVYNSVSGELYLVRDRFGVKPLFWGVSPDAGIVFSSSVAGVAKLIKATVDTDYCSRGLRYKAFESPNSEAPFKEVNSVASGSLLRVKLTDNKLSIKESEWYDLNKAVKNKANEIQDYSDDDLLSECQQLLKNAIIIRLRSDVPIAVSLSGGLDSSAIAAEAALNVEHLESFTYGSPLAQTSEGPEVDEFSKLKNINAQFVWPNHDKEQLDVLLERTLRFQEAPFTSLSVMAQNEVFYNVHKAGYKVLLGGQGGDEIFAGYRKFFFTALSDSLHKHDFQQSISVIYSFGIMMLHEASNFSLYMQSLNRYKKIKDFEFNFFDWSAPSYNLWGEGTALSDRQIDDIKMWSIPSLLRYEDRNSMGFGIETRLPFMDYRLVELALALPSRLKIYNGYGKWALRQITDTTVPNFIRLNRKKRGFDVTQNWVTDGVGENIRERINDNRLILDQYFKKNINLDKMLSDDALSKNSKLLDEALMLVWLIEPVRSSENCCFRND